MSQKPDHQHQMLKIKSQQLHLEQILCAHNETFRDNRQHTIESCSTSPLCLTGRRELDIYIYTGLLRMTYLASKFRTVVVDEHILFLQQVGRFMEVLPCLTDKEVCHSCSDLNLHAQERQWNMQLYKMEMSDMAASVLASSKFYMVIDDMSQQWQQKVQPLAITMCMTTLLVTQKVDQHGVWMLTQSLH